MKLAADCFFGGACDSLWSYRLFVSGAGRRNTGAGSVSKAASGVDGEGERTMHLPEKNSRQFGEMMVFALSQRNNSLALSRNGRRTRSTPRSG